MRPDDREHVLPTNELVAQYVGMRAFKTRMDARLAISAMHYREALEGAFGILTRVEEARRAKDEQRLANALEDLQTHMYDALK